MNKSIICVKCRSKHITLDNFCSSCGFRLPIRSDKDNFISNFMNIYNYFASEVPRSPLEKKVLAERYPLSPISGPKTMFNRIAGACFMTGFDFRRTERCFNSTETKADLPWIQNILSEKVASYNKVKKIADHFDKTTSTIGPHGGEAYSFKVLSEEDFNGLWFAKFSDFWKNSVSDDIKKIDTAEETAERNVSYGYYFRIAEELVEGWEK